MYFTDYRNIVYTVSMRHKYSYYRNYVSEIDKNNPFFQ